MGLKAIDNPKNVKVISDLDDLVSEDVAFVYKGKTYVLNPVTAEDMMKMEVARAKLVLMLTGRADGLALPPDEIYERYFELISPIVKDLTYPDIRSMNVVQLNALLNLVFRQLTGDPELYGEKKKTMKLRGL